MKGLILYRHGMKGLTTEDYSILRLLDVAKKRKIYLDVISMNQIDVVVASNKECTILIDGADRGLPDFVLPQMGALTTHYGLSVLRQWEGLGVHIYNNPIGISVAGDKFHTHQLLMQNNLPTPKTMIGNFPIDAQIVRREIGFPLVIKSTTGSCGVGIYLCEDEQSFEDVTELVYINNPNAQLIFQEFIEKSRGTDLRVFVLGGRIIGCMQRMSAGNFKANYSKGGSVKNFECVPELESLALKAADLVGLEMAGVDFLFDDDGFKICEVNSAPSFEGLEKASSRDIATCMLDHIAAKVHARNLIF